jgi:hypothetical protein
MLSTAADHYRFYRVYIRDTGRERIADTLVWLPTQVAMPTASSTDLTTATARDLTSALRHPSPASPLSPTFDSQVSALRQLARIFATATANDTDQASTQLPLPTPTIPPGFPVLPGVALSSAVATLPIVAPAPPVPTDPLPRVPTPSPVPTDVPLVPRPVVPPVPPAVTYQPRTRDARNRRRHTKAAEKKAAAIRAATEKATKTAERKAAADTKAAATKAANEKAAVDSTTQHQHNTRSRPRSRTIGGVTASLHTANLSTQLEPFPLS